MAKDPLSIGSNRQQPRLITLILASGMKYFDTNLDGRWFRWYLMELIRHSLQQSKGLSSKPTIRSTSFSKSAIEITPIVKPSCYLIECLRLKSWLMRQSPPTRTNESVRAPFQDSKSRQADFLSSAETAISRILLALNQDAITIQTPILDF